MSFLSGFAGHSLLDFRKYPPSALRDSNLPPSSRLNPVTPGFKGAARQLCPTSEGHTSPELQQVLARHRPNAGDRIPPPSSGTTWASQHSHLKTWTAWAHPDGCNGHSLGTDALRSRNSRISHTPARSPFLDSLKRRRRWQRRGLLHRRPAWVAHPV